MQIFQDARLVFYARALQNALLFSNSTRSKIVLSQGNQNHFHKLNQPLLRRSSYIGLLMILTCFVPYLSFAQQTQPLINSTLVGTVIDARTKESIPGANVSIKGTTHRVIADNDGKFSFVTGQKFPYTLVISYLGYKTQEIIASESPITIQLEDAVNQMNEVIVVGYGTQRRSDVTGSVSSVAKENLNQVTPSVDNLLRGAAPGVQVTQSSGQPGATATIRIRGGNSIYAGNEPLYVIDGFPVYNDNSSTSTTAGSGAGLNALSTINPSDIESIDILKDASSTAIYGSRGANGVIIITTKKGRRGTNNVAYQTYFGTQKLNKTLDLLNASQWAELRNDILASTGQPASFTPAQISELGEGTNWQNAAFREATVQNHELQFSGGDEKSRYLFSGNYFDQGGILRGTNFKRYSGRFNFERDVFAKLKFGLNVTATNTSSNGAAANTSTSNLTSPNTLTSIVSTSPVVPLNNSDGTYNLNNPYVTTPGNPVYDMDLIKNESKVNRLLGNSFVEYILLDGLTAKVSLGADLLNAKQNYFAPSNSTNGYDLLGTASVGTKSVSSWLNENTLTYNKLFNKHSLNALAGYTTQYSKSEFLVAGSKKFVTDETSFNSLQSGSQVNTPSSGESQWVLNSFLARINYSYNRKYNLTLSGRADGSSRFAKGNYWGYFPSAGISWNAGEEDFLKDNKNISSLKLRMSAGATGNQEIPLYQALAQLTPVTYNFATLTTGFAPTSLSNQDLKWETTFQYDAGVELGLFDGRINLVADVYFKKTRDLLLNVPIPVHATGIPNSLQNIGEVQNRGIELAINTDNLTNGDFKWRTSLVYSLNRNKIVSLGPIGNSFIPTLSNTTVNVLQPVQLVVGQPLGSFYGYLTNGIFQTGDDLANLPKISTLANTKPGDRRYVDVINDGVITSSDKVFLGSVQPKFSGSLSNSFSYKDFDLLVFFQGSYGNKVFNAYRQQLEITNLSQNASAEVANRWTPSNPSNEIPRAAQSPVAQVSNRYIEDGSYLRLKTLTLGYTLDKALASKIKSKQLRVYISAQNLATWTKYTGYDPEVSSFEQNNFGQGIDYGAYPNYKTFTAGLNVTF